MYWIHLLIAVLIVFLTPHIEKIEIIKKKGVELERKTERYFYFGIFLGILYWLFAIKYFIKN